MGLATVFVEAPLGLGGTVVASRKVVNPAREGLVGGGVIAAQGSVKAPQGEMETRGRLAGGISAPDPDGSS